MKHRAMKCRIAPCGVRRAVLTVSAALLLTAIVCLAQPAPVGSPFPIDPDPDGPQGAPAIAVAGDGRFAVAWPELGSPKRILARTFSAAGQATSSNLLVAEGSHGLVGADRGAANTFIVVWRHPSPAYGTFARRYDFEGQALDDSLDIYPYSTSYFCSDSAGRFVVVWSEYMSGAPPSGYIWGRRFNAGGELLFENVLAIANDSVPRLARPSCAEDGGFIVSWISYDYISGPDYRELFVRRIDASGDSVGGDKTVNTGEVANDGAAIVMSREGRWVAIWQDATERRPVARFYDEADQPLGPPQSLVEPLAPLPDGSRSFAALYHDVDQTFTLLWTLPLAAAAPQEEDALFAVLAQRFDTAGQPRGEVFQVLRTADTSSRRREPGVNFAAAADEHGNFVLTWAATVKGQLSAQRFNAADPGALVFSRPRLAVGEAGPEALVTVRRVDGSAGAISVDYTTIDGTALADADFEPSSGTLTFDDQDSQAQTLQVPILDDDAEEALETLVVALAEPTGGAELGSPHQTTVEIRDDEAAPPL
ncbi:MAG: hypothetical protein GY856_21300, partial [bacterium]|nr:hypothetical protein [bacterium]